MSRAATWISEDAPRPRHVFLAYDAATRTHVLECGIAFVEPLDPLASFDHPYYGWWDYERATCWACRASVQSKYTDEDFARARAILRRDALERS